MASKLIRPGVPAIGTIMTSQYSSGRYTFAVEEGWGDGYYNVKLTNCQPDIGDKVYITPSKVGDRKCGNHLFGDIRKESTMTYKQIIALAEKVERENNEQSNLDLDLEIINTVHTEYRYVISEEYRQYRWVHPENEPKGVCVLEEFTLNPEHIMQFLPENCHVSVTYGNKRAKACLTGYPNGKWICIYNTYEYATITGSIVSVILQAIAEIQKRNVKLP